MHNSIIDDVVGFQVRLTTIEKNAPERKIAMSKFITLVIIVAAGFIAYNYFTTGQLLPSSSFSGEEQAVESMADRFYKAKRMIRQAERSAAVGGVAGVSMVNDDMREIERVEQELAVLIETLESDSAYEKAEKLEREIREYKSSRGW